MRLRTLLIALAIVATSAALFMAVALAKFGGCDYHMIRESVSPNGRYVARWITVDFGMNAWSDEVLVQDRWLPGLPGLDGRPAGARVSRDLDAIDRGSALRWEGDTLVLFYRTRTPPVLDRTTVGGALVETRRR